jgi:sugar lactone lactonase YvrE
MTRTTKLIALALFGLPFAAAAWDRGSAVTFATLPRGTAHPEGIAAGEDGRIYVSTFDVSRAAGPGRIVIFDPAGRVVRVVNVAGSSNLLLGLDFHRVDHEDDDAELLVIDFGAKNVLRVDPVSGASSIFTTIPGGAAAGPNALTFDARGNVYISDSFQGIIWRTAPSGGAASIWAQSPLLTTTGVPPFGANGLAFNRRRTALFVANTGNDTVVKIPVATRAAEVFVNSINGADGLLIDEHDNIWVAANQADEIVVVEPREGRAIAKLGDFGGLRDGAPIGLLFPASLVFHGDFVYVTNLSLDLRLFSPTFDAVDSAWAAEVQHHTVARIPKRIPSVSGLR